MDQSHTESDSGVGRFGKHLLAIIVLLPLTYPMEPLPALLAIYERTRDWGQASEIARKLDAIGQGNFAARQAHYLCEQAGGAAPADAERLLREVARAR